MPDLSFEQQVAEALNRRCKHATVTEPTYLGDIRVRDCADCLPVNVAAAIEAASWVTFNETWTEDWSGPTPTPEEEATIKTSALAAALRVLRGDP